MVNGNINGEIARKRDIFLNAEKDYLDELKKDPRMENFIKKLKCLNPRDLSKIADELIEKVEFGKVEATDLEKVEAEITLVYATIVDAIRERPEKEKSKNEEHER